MRRDWKRLGMAAGIVLSLTLLGCGKNDGGAVTASIAGGAAAATAKGAPKTPPIRDMTHPKIVMQTSLGDMTVELDGKAAPQTVESFVRYVDSGFYDQTVFHQVLQGRVIVGGTYDVKMAEKKARTPIRNEAHNGLKNTRGTIAMARALNAVDSATSQFFFNLGDNTWLDYKERTLEGYGFCVFGRVVAGQDVLDKIAAVPVQNRPPLEQTPTEPVIIKSMRVLP